MKPKYDKLDSTQEFRAFHLWDALDHAVKDLRKIDSLIPAEISRIPTVACKDNASAIIVGRKDDLLSYIQTICRDHMHWGGMELEKGWRPVKPKKKRK